MFVTLLNIFFVASEQKLLKQIQFTRHCARAPVNLESYFEPKEEQFPDGLGKCTSEGKFQLYSLGAFLKELLIDKMNLTSEHFDPEETLIMSDTSDRVVQSAQSFLEAFYPLSNRQTNEMKQFRQAPQPGLDEYMKKNPDLQQKTVQTTTLTINDDDYMIGNGFDDCDQDTELDSINRHAQKGIIDEAQKQFNDSGLPGDFDKCDTFYDNYIAYEQSGQDLSKFTQAQKQAMVSCVTIWFNQVWARDERLNLRVSPHLETIEDNLFNDDRKLFLYFTHDTNVAPLMNQFNLVDQKHKPQFASNVTIQLIQTDEDEQQVRVQFESFEEKQYSVQEFKQMIKNDKVDQKKLCNDKQMKSNQLYFMRLMNKENRHNNKRPRFNKNLKNLYRNRRHN